MISFAFVHPFRSRNWSSVHTRISSSDRKPVDFPVRGFPVTNNNLSPLVHLSSAAIHSFCLGRSHRVPSEPVRVPKKYEMRRNVPRKKIGAEIHPWNGEFHVIFFKIDHKRTQILDSGRSRILFVRFQMYPHRSVVREHRSELSSSS